MNIESMAVSAVQNAISKTDYLGEQISKGDKEPSWDGSIYVYNTPADNHKKEDYRATVPVQVKGKKMNDHSAEKIQYRVSVVDLKNYKIIGGTMFFVVYISSSGETKIYYNSLLPFELNKILKNIGDRKSVSIEFTAFPTDKTEITNLVMNFARDKDKQALLRNGEYDLERAKKEFDLRKFQYGFAYSKLGYDDNNPAEYILNHDLYLYAHNEDKTVNIVVDHIPQADIVAETLKMNISVGGKQFYSKYVVNYTKTGKSVQIGNSFKITFSDDKATLKYNLAGNLKQQITDIEFILEFIANRYICINDTVIPFTLSDEEIEAFDVKNIKEHLEYLKTVQEILDNLCISTPLEVDKITDKDENKIKMLIRAFIQKQPITFNEKDIPPVAPVGIANLKILLVFKPIEEGKKYEIHNFFEIHLDVSAQTEDGMMAQTSQYTILDEESFLTVSNLNMNKVVNDLCSYNNKVHYSRVNLCVLGMIMAYDKSKDASLLIAAKQVTEWLIENDKDTEDIYTMNLYQCYLRERKLTTREKGNLFSLLEKHEGDTSIQTGLYILLGDFEEAKMCMSQLSDEEREAFKTYPLYNLFNEK